MILGEIFIQELINRSFNPLKYNVHLGKILKIKLLSHRKQFFHYKEQSVNAASCNNRCLLRETHKTHRYTLRTNAFLC
jgi:hypothetical protein